MTSPDGKKPISKKTSRCCTKMGMKRGPWTVEEDEILVSFIKKEGEGRWRSLPKRAGLLRCGKSCRLRWMNYLRPSVKRGGITSDEEDLILRLHRLLGNRWSLIAGRIPGRTDNEIKNYWNTHLRKKLLRQGIDPHTHKPLAANNTHQPGRDEVSGGQNLVEHNSTSHTANTTVSNGNGASKISTSVFGDEDDEDFDFCYDDKFSSFLNSLINDDPFDSNIPISQPFQTHNCTDEIVGTSSSSVHDQRPEDM
ncbi:hypothetical protein EUTSA_v10022057mg [Eutrema salsugineum]|uniref:Uncharacterized protein n=1 Tax=Eutrema salsugineum TaxID=72664 RepID=V4LXS8_EUTSA|nr:transcription repressor MYB5 [Eutrema salsugineum]ESQ48654.1 hypothetical protein EUTSA_v10022057mg [Eutrema salsugineum]